MRLLILTQKIDKDDPILGFFHTWVFRLSEKFESVVVVCLSKGDFDLPQNVQVFSLGKEKGKNRFYYIFQFFNLCFFQSLKYDAVFVHMNQEYVLLGGLFWKMLRKPVYLWRNHPQGSILTRLAVLLSNKVFCTSDKSFTKRFSKTILMPVGIDTYQFKDLKKERSKNSILFLSRISLVKRPESLIEALKILKDKDINFICNFYGEALPKDQNYFENLKNKIKEYGLENNVKFKVAVPNDQTPKIYSEHNIFINLTPSGSMDKTILESVACGCIPIVANDYFRDIFEPEMLVGEDIYDISNKIEFCLNLLEERKDEIRQRLIKYVSENHSLKILIEKLYAEILR
ncbi:MAG: glycosyltransferase family 4 protein [Patescibacteria group bacterium]